MSLSSFELGEISVLFALKTSVKTKKFNKARILQRLPFFQTFFTEIKSLPDENPIISLRFKAISQYASEDKVFSFLNIDSTVQYVGFWQPLSLIDKFLCVNYRSQ